MSKKHFQRLAWELCLVRPSNLSPTWEGDDFEAATRQWNRSVNAVATACKQSNPAFDEGRFFAACNADHYSPAMHGR